MEGWVDLGYPAMHRPGVELAISRSQVQRPTTTLLHYRGTRQLVSSRLDCANSILYGIPAKHISRLQRTHNALARVVTGTGFTDSSSSTLKRLQWLPIDAGIKFKIATLDFKALNAGSPPYLASLLHASYRHNPRRALRSASVIVLSVARSNLSFGSRTFRTAAPTVWNSLPPHVRLCTTLTTFRKHLKSHLFNPLFPRPSDPSQRIWFVRDLDDIQIDLLTYLFICLTNDSEFGFVSLENSGHDP